MGKPTPGTMQEGVGWQHSAQSGSGLRCIAMRDLDVLAKRPPMPKRALPDCIRTKLGYVPKKKNPKLAGLPPLAQEQQDTHKPTSKEKPTDRQSSQCSGRRIPRSKRAKKPAQEVGVSSRRSAEARRKKQPVDVGSNVSTKQADDSSDKLLKAGKDARKRVQGLVPRVGRIEKKPLPGIEQRKAEEMQSRADEIQKQLEMDLMDSDSEV